MSTTPNEVLVSRQGPVTLVPAIALGPGMVLGQVHLNLL